MRFLTTPLLNSAKFRVRGGGGHLERSCRELAPFRSNSHKCIVCFFFMGAKKYKIFMGDKKYKNLIYKTHRKETFETVLENLYVIRL